jgi:MFS family permease
VEIYIATFAGLLSTLLLAVVYLADRYEREPIELIQNFFLSGLLGQLVLILAVTAVGGDVSWSGPWILITVVCAALYLPFQLHRQTEMDERFDGIVYAVALVGGATCVIHLNNLPRVIAASPYRDALAPGAEPDLRDLLILATSPGFATELGQGLVVILAAVLVGAVLGTLQLRGWSPWRTAFVCVAVALAVTGLDLLTGGVWPVRGALAVMAVAVAAAVKRRSVFKGRPETPERDVLVMGLKTVLMVFGAALLAAVLLQAVVEQPVTGRRHPHDIRPGPGS